MTPYAESMVKIIIEECTKLDSSLGYWQQPKAAGASYSKKHIMPRLYERMHILSRSNPSLRRFLDDVGHVPLRGDEDPNRPWHSTRAQRKNRNA